MGELSFSIEVFSNNPRKIGFSGPAVDQRPLYMLGSFPAPLVPSRLFAIGKSKSIKDIHKVSCILYNRYRVSSLGTNVLTDNGSPLSNNSYPPRCILNPESPRPSYTSSSYGLKVCIRPTRSALLSLECCRRCEVESGCIEQ